MQGVEACTASEILRACYQRSSSHH